MKTKKIILLLTLIYFTATISSAQINVTSNGYVGVYSVLSPVFPFQSFGNAVFCQTNSISSYAAYIRAASGASGVYSGPSTPDYTWYNNDQTGLYLPAASTIGITCGGTETMSITPNQVNSWNNVSYGTGNISNLSYSNAITWLLNCSAYSSPYQWRFYVYGGGQAWAYSWNTLSDARLKENVNTIPDALNKVLKLRGVNFTYINQKAKDSANTNSQLPSEPAKLQMGVIAQEVEQIVPEVVNTGKDGLKGVQYQNLVGLLIEALKQEDKKVNDLQNMVNNCCNMGQNGVQGQTPASSTATNVGTTTGTTTGTTATGQATLNQNVPNPFNTTTNITCFIPEQSGSASLLIMDMTGALKTTIPITGKDSQTITINAGQLTAGMYYYTLLVDGKEVDTKKMILTQ